MRAIGQLEGEEPAQCFADYLFVQNIEARVEPAAGGNWTVWVVDEDRVDEARALLSRFRSMPEAAEFEQAARAAADRRREERREATAEIRKLRRPDTWGRPRGGATLFLLAASIGVALVTRLGQNATWTGWLLISNLQIIEPARFWESLVEIQSGQAWRLFTPVFLHFSLWHLLFNLLWIQDLGSVLEERIGTWRFAGVVALVALVSNLTQYVAGGAAFGGLSGVVYGVFGYLWVRAKRDFNFGLFISPLTSTLLMVFLALGIFGLLGPTANAAHFSGLVTGGLLGWGASHSRRV